ncbi:protein S100-A13 isoform X1 [Taeniopygia guttata]|uniref:protein S100-A13 isoform X1 n=1 Tax=Taeniopygia guttata TaxID=59729 RepID=UPI003BB8D2D4
MAELPEPSEPSELTELTELEAAIERIVTVFITFAAKEGRKGTLTAGEFKELVRLQLPNLMKVRGAAAAARGPRGSPRTAGLLPVPPGFAAVPVPLSGAWRAAEPPWRVLPAGRALAGGEDERAGREQRRGAEIWGVLAADRGAGQGRAQGQSGQEVTGPLRELGRRAANKRGFPEPEHRCCSWWGAPDLSPHLLLPRGGRAGAGPGPRCRFGVTPWLRAPRDGRGHAQIALVLVWLLGCHPAPHKHLPAALGGAWGAEPWLWPGWGSGDPRQRCRAGHGGHQLRGISARPLQGLGWRGVTHPAAHPGWGMSPFPGLSSRIPALLWVSSRARCRSHGPLAPGTVGAAGKEAFPGPTLAPGQAPK